MPLKFEKGPLVGTAYACKAVCDWQRLKAHITNNACKGLHPVADCKQTSFPYSFRSVHTLTSASRMLSQHKPLAKTIFKKYICPCAGFYFAVAEQAEKIPQLNWGWIKKL